MLALGGGGGGAEYYLEEADFVLPPSNTARPATMIMEDDVDIRYGPSSSDE
jgi:hypothetical protein